MEKEFKKFAKSVFTLQIWKSGKLIFKSKKEGVGGLMDFIKRCGKTKKNLIIFDKVIGNVAALLFAYLEAKEVFGVVGSSMAKKTLRKYKIKFYFKKTIPNILNKTKTDLCPMEKLSKKKIPEELYDCLKK